MSHQPSPQEKRKFMRSLHQRHPGFRIAVAQDARFTCSQRGERSEFRSGFDTFFQVLRLMWVSDAFAVHVSYRLRTALLRRGVPILPRILHRYAMRSGQVSIGPGVYMHPGVYLVHGQLVLDGLVEVQSRVVLSPWVTVGLRAGNVQGPTIEPDVNIGTGAKIIGPVTIGAESLIGANAVVVDDVPRGVTAVGLPARVVTSGRDDEDGQED
jgi:serine O-acetyltransferase